MFLEYKYEWFIHGFHEILFRMVMLRVEELLAKAGGNLIIKLRKKGVYNGCDSHLWDKLLHMNCAQHVWLIAQT